MATMDKKVKKKTQQQQRPSIVFVRSVLSNRIIAYAPH